MLTRPAVEAGERLGYLPGDIGEKLAPYLRPLNDALNERLGGRRAKQLMTEGAIEIAPIAFMRGRTLNNAFIVIDEAQNCTYGQIKMMLTRLGWHSTMVVTGDLDQSDLLDGLSGLAEICSAARPDHGHCRGAVSRGRHRAPFAGRRNAVGVVSSATLPGPSLFGGFGSLFGRFNSLFARLGNSLRPLSEYQRLRGDRCAPDGSKSRISQFIPVEQRVDEVRRGVGISGES